MAAMRKRNKTAKQRASARQRERQPEKGVSGDPELRFSKAKQARGRLSEA